MIIASSENEPYEVEIKELKKKRERRRDIDRDRRREGREADKKRERLTERNDLYKHEKVKARSHP